MIRHTSETKLSQGKGEHGSFQKQLECIVSFTVALEKLTSPYLKPIGIC